MSTRSNIGVERADGSVIGIYCHFDGYPTHHVPLLTKFHNYEAAALALVSYGDMSQLGEYVGEAHSFESHRAESRFHNWCLYYGRDRGETGTEARTYPTRDAFDRAADNEYAYLFRDGKWWGRERRGPWREATSLLSAHDKD